MTIFGKKILKQAEEYHGAVCKKYFSEYSLTYQKTGCSLKIFL